MTNVNDLPGMLRETCPHLAPLLDEETAAWRREAGGQYPTADYVFGSILAPHVSRLLRNQQDARAKAEAQEIFTFLEELMHDSNPSVRDVVDVSFCEQLADDRTALSEALKLAGPLVNQSLSLSA